MEAVCGEHFLNINLSHGVVFHTTPTLLQTDPEHRIIPFNMIKQQLGNWEEVRDWFIETLGWVLTFHDHTPINIDKERDLIAKFLKSRFHPSLFAKKEPAISEKEVA